MMTHNGKWLLVDDQVDAVGSFAEQLCSTNLVAVEVMTPEEARDALLTKRYNPAGVLMDVQFSAIPGEQGTGPGVAQDIRVKQRSSDACEFPIVRFAGASPVANYVNGDPTSDDLFDLKIQKESLSRDLDTVLSSLQGLRSIYNFFMAHPGRESNLDLDALFGCSTLERGEWSHYGLESRLAAGTQTAPHVAAGTFIRNFLMPSGLLLDETMLAVRLGVDKTASGSGWSEFAESLPFRFRGVGAMHFPRWWARGLDEWWFNKVDTSAPLISLEIDQRVELLRKAVSDTTLVPIGMPKGSPGNRPWHLCAFGLEMDPPIAIPVDPDEAVRLTHRVDSAPWVDASYVSLKQARQCMYDARLNKVDLSRLSKKYGD